MNTIKFSAFAVAMFVMNSAFASFTGGGGGTPVPEPESLALVAIGGAAIAFVKWKNRNKK